MRTSPSTRSVSTESRSAPRFAHAQLAMVAGVLWSSGCNLLDKEYAEGATVDVENGAGLENTTSGTTDDNHPGGTGSEPSDDGGSDGTTDSGADDGGGTGSGSGGGSGSGSGSGEAARVDCTPGAVPVTGNIDGCVSDTLTCGDSVVATTMGGNSVMDDRDYLAWFCTPFPEGEYAGAERTYNVTVPAGQSATFTLESPCAELDIFALRWELWMNNELCPEYGNSVIECEADDSRDGGSITVYADPTRETNYLVIIDGRQGEQEAFALDITCD